MAQLPALLAAALTVVVAGKVWLRELAEPVANQEQVVAVPVGQPLLQDQEEAARSS